MLSTRRKIVVWTLIVLASLIAIGSVLTTWVDRQMLDTESWSKASADLIEDPQVRDAVSVYIVDQLYTNVDVAGALEERLPPDLKSLAGTIAGAARQPATDAVKRLLEAPRVQQLFINASTTAQEKLTNVLEDKTGAGITTGNGVVTLDLGELVTSLGEELGLSASTLDRIPPDAGELEIMRSDQLDAAQAGVRSVQVLSTWLLVLVLVLYALAIFLARGARRETLRNIGCAFVLVGLAVLVVRRVAGNYAVDALTQPTSEDSGKRVWLISTEVLAQIGWAAVIYGVVTVAGTLLAGPSKWGGLRAAADRAGPQRAPRHRVVRRRRGLPGADRVGPDARAADALGDRAARSVDSRRDRRVPGTRRSASSASPPWRRVCPCSPTPSRCSAPARTSGCWSSRP